MRKSTSTASRVRRPRAPCAKCSGPTRPVRWPHCRASSRARRYGFQLCRPPSPGPAEPHLMIQEMDLLSRPFRNNPWGRDCLGSRLSSWLYLEAPGCGHRLEVRPQGQGTLWPPACTGPQFSHCPAAEGSWEFCPWASDRGRYPTILSRPSAAALPVRSSPTLQMYFLSWLHLRTNPSLAGTLLCVLGSSSPPPFSGPCLVT